MKQFLQLLLVIIVVAGSYAAMRPNSQLLVAYTQQKSNPQDYGASSLAEFAVQWEDSQDTTFTLTITADPDILEIVSIKYLGEYKRSALNAKPNADTDIKMPIGDCHNVFIKTKLGITNISFLWDPEEGGIVLLNGKVTFFLNPQKFEVITEVNDAGYDLDAFAETPWQWQPIYDQWVARQKQNKADYIDITKENF